MKGFHRLVVPFLTLSRKYIIFVIVIHFYPKASDTFYPFIQILFLKVHIYILRVSCFFFRKQLRESLAKPQRAGEEEKLVKHGAGRRGRGEMCQAGLRGGGGRGRPLQETT